MSECKDIYDQVSSAISELIEAARPDKNSIFVIGCSTSEVTGGKIGKSPSYETAQAISSAALDILGKNGLFLAAQCCEHLNRALVIEKELLERVPGLERVNAVPQIHAGGSFATSVYSAMKDPVLVEHISADLGIDIGQTLIGMHLRHVAVPVRLSVRNIGEAVITAARTRPKYIGGERAVYLEM